MRAQSVLLTVMVFLLPDKLAVAQDSPSLEHEGYIETIPGTDVSFTMVPIPGGSFRMGSLDSESGRKPDEGPLFEVEISPFWMCSTEVTWELFDLYMLSKDDREPKTEFDAITRPTGPYVDPTYGMGHDGFPAITMTHHSAMEFTRWLSQVTEREYRLPTEAEWEYACRAGTTTAYWFGNDPKRLHQFDWFYDEAHPDQNSEAYHRVGTKRPNPWGLYDMHGNVSEWCLDQYYADAYFGYGSVREPHNPVSLPTDRRYPHVARGGSFDKDPLDCRSAVRHHSDPSWNSQDPQIPPSIWWDVDTIDVGFRIVRAVDDPAKLRKLRSQVTKMSGPTMYGKPK